MDLIFTAEDRRFRDEVATWLRANVPGATRPPDGEEACAFDRAWQRQQFDGGWAGISWPQEYGGLGLSPLRQFIWHEEYARARAPYIGMCFLALNQVGPKLMLEANAAQKDAHLPAILRGEEIWCQGYSEPGAGSDLASLRTKGVVDGDHLVVNGQKVWTSYAQYSDFQELLVRTDPAAPKHKGITFIIVDLKNTRGIDIRPLELMSGGKHFSEVFYDDVRIPLANVVGSLNDGWKVTMASLAFERGTAFTADQIDLAGKVEALITYASEHPAPGGRKNAIDDDELRRRLAMVRAEVAAMRAMTLATVSRIEREGKPGPEGSMMRLFYGALTQRIYQLGMDLLGPERLELSPLSQGWTHPYLRTFCHTISGGSAQIQREVIAGRVLGLPRSR